ncbi:MAG: hypothetical protein V5A55_14185 [Halovenus sp.]
MATSTDRIGGTEGLTERGPVVGGALVVVTVLAVGAASFVGGATTGFGIRLPVYVLSGAGVFVGALLTMRYLPQDGTTVLRRATAAGFLGFVGIGLGTEAVVYGLIVVAPELPLYVMAAVTVAGGLAYWSVRNWHTVDDLTRPW